MLDYGDTPGPGSYCSRFELSTFQAPIYSIARKLKDLGDGVKPGPGQYDSKLGPGGPSFSLHQRTNDPRNKNPGPGAYDPYAYERLPNFTPGQRLDARTPAKKPSRAHTSLPLREMDRRSRWDSDSSGSGHPDGTCTATNRRSNRFRSNRQEARFSNKATAMGDRHSAPSLRISNSELEAGDLDQAAAKLFEAIEFFPLISYNSKSTSTFLFYN